MVGLTDLSRFDKVKPDGFLQFFYYQSKSMTGSTQTLITKSPAQVIF